MNKKLKLSILGTLIASSTLFIALPIVSCSTSSENNVSKNSILNPNSDELITASKTVTEFLRDELLFAKTKQAQKNIIGKWKLDNEIPSDYIKSIKNVLNFTDEDGNIVYGLIAIESVTFNSIIKIPDNGGPIFGPKLKVNLKKGYTSEKEILIDVDYLSEALADFKFYSSDEYIVSFATTSVLKPLISNANSRTAQKLVLDSWVIGKEVSPDLQGILTPLLPFE
ncbi:MAG: hypothetical protein ACRCUM_00870, partial [Mycoplasmoidaceae bacterium]